MRDATANRVLHALPPGERRQVTERCEAEMLSAGTVLDRAGAPIRKVHFPLGAVISTVQIYNDGSMIEMANIGCEGCTATGLALGHPRQLNTNLVQLGGEALVLDAEDCVDLRNESEAFDSALLASVQALFQQVLVSGACNGVHGARQRLARWLLTMDDRNDGDVMELTQDFLSEMLGVRRATVSESASAMRDAGLIDYSRGRVRITDREGLRRESCECYDRVNDALSDLLPQRYDD